MRQWFCAEISRTHTRGQAHTLPGLDNTSDPRLPLSFPCRPGRSVMLMIIAYAVASYMLAAKPVKQRRSKGKARAVLRKYQEEERRRLLGDEDVPIPDWRTVEEQLRAEVSCFQLISTRCTLRERLLTFSLCPHCISSGIHNQISEFADSPAAAEQGGLQQTQRRPWPGCLRI